MSFPAGECWQGRNPMHSNTKISHCQRWGQAEEVCSCDYLPENRNFQDVTASNTSMSERLSFQPWRSYQAMISVIREVSIKVEAGIKEISLLVKSLQVEQS